MPGVAQFVPYPRGCEVWISLRTRWVSAAGLSSRSTRNSSHRCLDCDQDIKPAAAAVGCIPTTTPARRTIAPVLAGAGRLRNVALQCGSSAPTSPNRRPVRPYSPCSPRTTALRDSRRTAESRAPPQIGVVLASSSQREFHPPATRPKTLACRSVTSPTSWATPARSPNATTSSARSPTNEPPPHRNNSLPATTAHPEYRTLVDLRSWNVSPKKNPRSSDLGFCSSDWTRTSNPSVNSRMLCRLSYGGMFDFFVGPGGPDGSTLTHGGGRLHAPPG
jgi:hypothetical protein